MPPLPPAFLPHADNKAVAAATIIAVSETNSAYPVSNLKLPRLSRVHRTTSDLTAVTYEFDLGAAFGVDVVGLLNTNLTSAATVAVAAGSTTAEGDYSTTIAYVREYDWIKVISANYRYWKFTVTDAANPDGYLEIGYPVLGDATSIVAQANDWSFIDEYINQDPGSEFGVRNVEELFNRNRFQFELRNKTAAEIEVFRTLYRNAKMNVNPLLFLPDTSVNDGYFGTFSGPLRRVKGFYSDSTSHDSVSVEFVEDSRGKKLA